jgi:hypothetical protein
MPFERVERVKVVALHRTFNWTRIKLWLWLDRFLDCRTTVNQVNGSMNLGDREVKVFWRKLRDLTLLWRSYGLCTGQTASDWVNWMEKRALRLSMDVSNFLKWISDLDLRSGFEVTSVTVKISSIPLLASNENANVLCWRFLNTFFIYQDLDISLSGLSPFLEWKYISVWQVCEICNAQVGRLSRQESGKRVSLQLKILKRIVEETKVKNPCHARKLCQEWIMFGKYLHKVFPWLSLQDLRDRSWSVSSFCSIVFCQLG